MPDDSAPARPVPGAWTPGPLPPEPSGRRSRAGVLGFVLVILLVVGAVGTWGLRQVASTGARAGAGSPQAAAEQLVTALARRDVDRVAGLVAGEEQRLVEVYGDRLLALIDQRLGELGGAGSGRPALGATDVRFRKVAGGDEAALVELTGGTFSAGGVKLGAAQVNQRLAEATHGRLGAVRLVARADGGRWRVSVLASLADTALSAAGAAPSDPAALFGGATEAGASDPEAAVAAVLDQLQAGDAAGAIERLAPDEARLLGGVRTLAAKVPLPAQGPDHDLADALLRGQLPGQGFTLSPRHFSSEQIADGVVRVTVSGSVAAEGRKPEPLPAEGVQVVVLRDGDLWYPSLVFTAVDHAPKG